jgi:hypothetical protein
MSLIHDVEQGKPEWDLLRAGRPTSSKFGSLVTGTGKVSDGLKDYALTLATEVYLKGMGLKITDGFNGSWGTDRGIEMEPVSRADYEMRYQTPVQQVGFITDDLMRWGTSTDGFVGEDGLVEFKNLIATTFFKALIYWKRHGKTEPKYMPQLQGELMISERAWVDLYLFNPSYPDPIIERIYPDLEYQAVLKTQLGACIVERDRLLKIVNGE